MNKKFTIRLNARDKDKLHISAKVIDYLEDFVIANILKEKNVILNEKLDVLLSFILLKHEKGYQTNEVEDIVKPRFISEENLKIYNYILPLNAIEQASCEVSKLLDLIFESLKLFFSEYYKRVSVDFLNEVWKRLDIEYLMNIPYPAEPRERKEVYTFYGY